MVVIEWKKKRKISREYENGTLVVKMLFVFFCMKKINLYSVDFVIKLI